MLNKPESCRGCPLSCSPLGSMMGFVPASGSGDNGVLVVLEAAGEHEVAEGIPTVGKAGYFMWQNLKRVGIEREGFRIHNVVSCRPPDNKLANMPYEAKAIEHCEPNLDTTIHAHVAHALSKNKTPVIVALGKISVKRVMGTELTEAQLKLDYQCYALWNNRYKCWVIAADHPSYLMRGKTELLPILQFAFQRALEIAENGIRLDAPKFPDDYLLNPTLDQFTRWVEEFEAYYAQHPNLILSYDIETPHKKGASEDELEKDDDDYVILQCSFSYIPGKAASVQWNKEYMPLFQRLFASECAKCGWNSNAYDNPRIQAQLPMHGELYDGMQMWHVLNSSLPKGLGFVTPFYVPTAPLWKYLGSDAVGLNGAYYNAMDSDMALRNVLGIMDHLKKSDLWDVYKRHMVDVHRVFSYMSEQGVPFSGERRLEAELLVSGKLKEINKEIQAAVPQKIHKYKVFKKAPKDVTGLIQIPSTIDVPTCSLCHERNIKASHFKSIGKAKLSVCTICGEKHKKKLTYDHEFVAPADNPCMGSTAIKAPMLVMSWARYLPFKISKKSLMEYQAAQKHAPIREKDKKTGLMKVVFHEKAIIKLQQKYPEDALYKLILEFRGLQKLLGTYIGVTKYIEVEVPDDYILQPGESFISKGDTSSQLFNDQLE